MSQGSERTTSGCCPAEGVLVQYLDDALEGGERARVEAHLASCPACTGRLEAIERSHVRVRSWLVRHDPAVPARASYDLAARPRSGIRARWALAAGIVLAVALAAGPARGWLQERLGLGAPTGSEGGDPTPAGEGPATAFRPPGPTVRLGLDAGVTGRRLVVERSPDSMVTLRGPGPDVELVVRPDRVEIRDALGPARDYRLAVPALVERVVVRVPGADSLVIVPGPAGVQRTVEVPRGGG